VVDGSGSFISTVKAVAGGGRLSRFYRQPSHRLLPLGRLPPPFTPIATGGSVCRIAVIPVA